MTHQSLFLVCVVILTSSFCEEAFGRRKKSASRRPSSVQKNRPNVPEAYVTSVGRIVVPHFRAVQTSRSIKGQFFKIRSYLQRSLVREINSVSYLEALPANITLFRSVKGMKITAKKKSVDGVLTGNIEGKILQVALRSGHNGRALAAWTFPLPFPLTKKENVDLLVQELVTTLVNDFPYRGYVTGLKGKTILLNLGRKQALKKGDHLKVFEFQGKDPNFQSQRVYIGEIEITKIAVDEAIGVVKEQVLPIHRFAKLDFTTAPFTYGQELQRSYFPDFWIGIGGSSFFLDSQGAGTNPLLSLRLIKVTLTPLINLNFGYSDLSVDIYQGQAVNSVNRVDFLMTEILYQIITSRTNQLGYITSFGAHYSTVGVSPSEPEAEVTLAPTTTMGPTIAQRIQWGFSPRARVYLEGKLRYPYFSKDPQNGESEVLTAFATNVAVGLRVDLTRSLAIENIYSSEFSRQVINDGELMNLGFNITFRALYGF